MTGITRVSKESVFSDLNNLTVITTTSDQYADCFGFTEEVLYEIRSNRESGYGRYDVILIPKTKEHIRHYGFAFEGKKVLIGQK